MTGHKVHPSLFLSRLKQPNHPLLSLIWSIPLCSSPNRCKDLLWSPVLLILYVVSLDYHLKAVTSWKECEEMKIHYWLPRAQHSMHCRVVHWVGTEVRGLCSELIGGTTFIPWSPQKQIFCEDTKNVLFRRLKKSKAFMWLSEMPSPASRFHMTVPLPNQNNTWNVWPWRTQHVQGCSSVVLVY